MRGIVVENVEESQKKRLRLDRNEGRKSPSWAVFTTLKVWGRDKNLYMHRLRLLQTPWFGIYLHRIYRPDEDHALHDHPWTFTSFVLWGSYWEEVPARKGFVEMPNGHSTVHIRWFNRKVVPALHRISGLSCIPVWTLIFAGPRVREWGFQTVDGGWIESSKFEESV